MPSARVERALHRLGARHRRAADDRGAHQRRVDAGVANERASLYRDVNILGGFAAPLFLWLAGLGGRAGRRRGPRADRQPARAAEGIVRRGLEIFILAFLFRLQAFIVSPGNHLVTLFRVDILNIMGPSIVAAGGWCGRSRATAARRGPLCRWRSRSRMLTPIVRASAAGRLLPVWVQWYLRPAGELTVFTLLPWAGFVFAGGAVGVAARRGARRACRAAAARGARRGRRGADRARFLHRRHVRRSTPLSSFWTSSPTWFAIRVGILMLALSWCTGWSG